MHLTPTALRMPNFQDIPDLYNCNMFRDIPKYNSYIGSDSQKFKRKIVNIVLFVYIF